MSVLPPSLTTTFGSVYPPSPPTLPPAQAAAAPLSSTGPAAIATISPGAELLGRLQRLRHTAPATFKATVGKFAQTASEAANAAPAGTVDQASLKSMADDLWQASKTGDVSSLKTHAHAHHHQALKPAKGGTGSLLTNMMQTLDLVLGPDAPRGPVSDS